MIRMPHMKKLKLENHTSYGCYQFSLSHLGILLLALLYPLIGFSSIPQQTVTPSSIGFSLSNTGTDWELTPAPPDADNIVFLFRGKQIVNGHQATLTARKEKLEQEKDLKQYTRKWMNEYPKFGYNVLGQKPFTLDGRNAYVIDLISAASEKQSRQVISEKNGTVVVLTCLDNKEQFSRSLPFCNKIIRSFKWE